MGAPGAMGAMGAMGENGMPGDDGFSSLVITRTEGNCVVIETGLDRNRNGQLDASELTAGTSSTLCESVPAEVTALSQRIDSLEGAVIPTPAVITVRGGVSTSTSTFPNLDGALSFLSSRRLGGQGLLTIQVERGRYMFSEPLTFDHPDGGRILIIGDEADPGTVDLIFQQSNGLEVQGGATLARFSGFELGYQGAASEARGIVVTQHSELGLGAVIVSDFPGVGILVERQSAVTPVDRQVSSGEPTLPAVVACPGAACGGVGVRVTERSLAEFVNTRTPDVGLNVTGFGSDGVEVSRQSTLVADFLRSANNGGRGILVDSMSMIIADDATVASNVGDAVFVQHNGTARLHRLEVTGSGVAVAVEVRNAAYAYISACSLDATDIGIRAAENSTVIADGCEIDADQDGVDASDRAYVDIRNVTVGATSAPMRGVTARTGAYINAGTSTVNGSNATFTPDVNAPGAEHQFIHRL